MKEETLVRQFALFVSNNYPEKAFIKDFGQELFDRLKNEAFAIDRGRCAGCGHVPPDHRKKDCLFLHITEFNKAQPELTKGITLCKSCHTTQHIESAIKQKMIVFVNSTYDQSNLVRLCRSGQVHGAIAARNIVVLKKTPQQFLKEWYAGEVKFTSTLKVIFTNNFLIDDL